MHTPYKSMIDLQDAGISHDHIVRCVNAHDKLVKALERLLGAASLSSATDRAFANKSPAIQAARAALALAKGE